MGNNRVSRKLFNRRTKPKGTMEKGKLTEISLESPNSGERQEQKPSLNVVVALDVDVGDSQSHGEGESVGVGVHVLDDEVTATEDLHVAHVGLDFEGLQVPVDGQRRQHQRVEGRELHRGHSLGQVRGQVFQHLQQTFVVRFVLQRPRTRDYAVGCDSQQHSKFTN